MRGLRSASGIGVTGVGWMLALVAPAGLAAGLGELQLRSHINEPFEARVAVTGTAAELEDARIVLGGADGSAADGITVDAGEGYSTTLVTRDGSPYVLIRSRRRVAEPLLHLVLRLRSLGSQVQREYDVLLDLPDTSPAPAGPVSRPSVPVRALQAQPDGPEAGAIIADTGAAGSAAPSARVGPGPGPAAAAAAPGPSSTPAPASSASRPQRSAATARTPRPPPPLPPSGPAVEAAPAGTGTAPGTAPDEAEQAAIADASPIAVTAPAPSSLRLHADDQLRAWVATAAAAPAVAGAPLPLRLDAHLATPPASAATDTATAASAPASSPPPSVVPAPSAGGAWPRSLPWIVLALLVLLALWWRRRRIDDERGEEDEEPSTAVVDAGSRPPVAAASASASAPARHPAAGSGRLDDPDLLADFQEPLRESMETSDPGVGFYGEVAQLLLSALDRDPQRADLRLKLLEIFHDARETERFRLHAQRYRRQHPATEDPHWAHIRSMGLELMPDEPLFAADAAVSASATAAAEARPQRFYEYLDTAALDDALRSLASEYRRLYADSDYLGGLQQALAPLRPQPTPLDRLDDEATSTAARPIRLYGRWEPARTAGDDTDANACGQVYVAQRLGRRKVITATRASRHALAVARSARERGLACRVHMRESDHRRHAQALQALAQYDVDWVLTPDSADGDARTAALGDWLQTPDTAFYVGSTAAGPHPYPSIVRDLRAVLGAETRAQLIGIGEGPPLAVVVGRDGGSAALSLLQAFLDDRDTALYCVESGADGAAGEHRREHAWLRDTGRVRYTSGFIEGTTVVDTQIPDDGVRRLTPDSRSAATFARRLARETEREGAILVLLCGASQIDFEI